ncbi:MAG: 2-polyprenyl-3-methyl-6-methoxy-1,4-benzoquinone monooxygenase [Legionella sp.]|nr:2-polyprenyl-3-methyl-6-methoxy-1,4-benzoquinone monooxygenase [Legionella sp.]
MLNASFLDTLISEVDNALRALVPPSNRITARYSPARDIAETALTDKEKKHIAGLMRVNHAGEVCAQALYQGQALTARLTDVKEQMAQAAAEEVDHLAWCEERLSQLGSKPSILNPIWYGGSLLLGALAGLAGDKISLGFLAETERQVTSHLQNHLKGIPPEDNKTKAILERMQDDEAHHAEEAVAAGAIKLPFVVRQLMTQISKLMTKSSYYF